MCPLWLTGRFVWWLRYAQKCKFHHPPDVTPAFHPLAPPTDVTIGLNKEVRTVS